MTKAFSHTGWCKGRISKIGGIRRVWLPSVALPYRGYMEHKSAPTCRQGRANTALSRLGIFKKLIRVIFHILYANEPFVPMTA